MPGKTRKSRGTAGRASPCPTPSFWRLTVPNGLKKEPLHASRRTKPEKRGKGREGRPGSPHCAEVADTPACGNSLELDMQKGRTTAP